MEKNNNNSKKSSKGKNKKEKVTENNNIVDLNHFKIKKNEEKILKKEERKKELIDINPDKITYDIYKENIDNLTEDMNNNYLLFNDVEELDLEKDLKDYLKEYDRTTLIYICTNLKLLIDLNFIPDIDFTFKKKEEYIKIIISIIKKEMKSILEGMKKAEIELIKDLVKYNILGINAIEDTELEKNINLLRKLGLIFTKKIPISSNDNELEYYKEQDNIFEMMNNLKKIEELKNICENSDEDMDIDEIIDNFGDDDFISSLIEGYNEFEDFLEENNLIMTNIHLPYEVKKSIKKNKLKSIDEYYDEKNEYYINLINSLVNIYGAIYIEDAYKILSSITDITREELNKIITFRTIVETEAFTSNHDNSAIMRINLIEDQMLVEKLLKIKKEKYTLGVYVENLDITNIRKLDEYTDFMNYIYDIGCISKKYKKGDYDRIDIKAFDSIIFNYIFDSQVDIEKTEEFIRNIIETLFDVKNKDINQILKLIKKITDKYYKWNLGGKI